MTNHARASAASALHAAQIVPLVTRDQSRDLAVALVAEGWTPPASPPLTEEPTDLAARVVDKDGDVWACVPSVGWLSASTPDARDWHVLLREFSPLHLYTPEKD